MNQEKYDLVFSGQIAPNFELAQVKKNVQALFRVDDSKIQVLFSGKAITLKKGLDLDVASKYRVAMKKAGARVDLVLCPEEKTTPVAAPASSSASQLKNSVNATEPSGFSTELGAQPAAAKVPREEIKAPNFGVAAVGDDLLSENEKTTIAAIKVDTSGLSIAPQEGNLVDESELFHLDPVQVTIPDFDVAPVGSDVLKEEERVKVQPVRVDISSLSLAEVGGKLSPDSPKPPPAPDVSHIKLEV
jgi:hypothetical protein